MELSIRVQPRSSRNRVEIVDGVVKVWTTASPTDGQANAAVCQLIAEQVAVPKSHVTVIRGHSGRSKTLQIDGLSDAEVAARLAEQ